MWHRCRSNFIDLFVHFSCLHRTCFISTKGQKCRISKNDWDRARERNQRENRVRHNGISHWVCVNQWHVFVFVCAVNVCKWWSIDDEMYSYVSSNNTIIWSRPHCGTLHLYIHFRRPFKSNALFSYELAYDEYVMVSHDTKQTQVFDVRYTMKSSFKSSLSKQKFASILAPSIINTD